MDDRWSGTLGRTGSGAEHRHRRLREGEANDRGRLDDRPLLASQQIQPGGEQGLDGGRNVEVGQVAGRLPALVGEVE